MDALSWALVIVLGYALNIFVLKGSEDMDRLAKVLRVASLIPWGCIAILVVFRVGLIVLFVLVGITFYVAGGTLVLVEACKEYL